MIDAPIKSVSSRAIVPEAEVNELISPGQTRSGVVDLLGDPASHRNEEGYDVLRYPAAFEIKRGATICVIVIPIPLRITDNGEYKFFFDGNVLKKITMSSPDASFYGVWVDDSGGGVSWGDVSKCDV